METYMPTPYKFDIEETQRTYASCDSSLKTKTKDFPPAVDIKTLPESDVEDPNSTAGSPNSVPCKSKAASVPAGSRNSSASVTAGGSDPAASRNRPAVNSAGRPNPTGRVGQAAHRAAAQSKLLVGLKAQHLFLLVDQFCLGDPSTDNDIGIVDSGCSRSMTGNKEKLDDFVQVKGGIVKIWMHFNLFSVSQICDKKNKVLFTDTDCLVLTEEFQLPDESQVVLRIPRERDLYTFSISELQPEQNVTCLVAKASLDESTRWHRRMAHVNFKTINKLAKEGRTLWGQGELRWDIVIPDPQAEWVVAERLVCPVLACFNSGLSINKSPNKTPYELISGEGPSSSNGPSVMERNADYAKELAKLQRQEYEAKDASCHDYGKGSAGIDSAGGVSAGSTSAGIDSAGGVSAGSTSAGSDPAGGNPAGSFSPAGSYEPADQGNPAVSTIFFCWTLFNVLADESTHFPPGQSLAQCIVINLALCGSEFSLQKRVNTIHPQSQILGDLASPNPTSIAKALRILIWVTAMQEEMQQSSTESMDTLDTRKSEGIDYDVDLTKWPDRGNQTVFAFASYMGFLYIDSLLFPKHVFRGVKAWYGLPQPPRAWYRKDWSAFLLQTITEDGTIDKTCHQKGFQGYTFGIDKYVKDMLPKFRHGVLIVPNISYSTDFSSECSQEIFKFLKGQTKITLVVGCQFLGRRLIFMAVMQEAVLLWLLLLNRSCAEDFTPMINVADLCDQWHLLSGPSFEVLGGPYWDGESLFRELRGGSQILLLVVHSSCCQAGFCWHTSAGGFISTDRLLELVVLFDIVGWLVSAT
ncbi:ribonuclease H-like domain-containing protein [Tanacetum coccineum]|uniref:Ribonuclease H-like domain-containing protein n=1 Tax=Tanacetum coccineum TaxID=301880 RepID=A0ABQ5GZ51_9ASTR